MPSPTFSPHKPSKFTLELILFLKVQRLVFAQSFFLVFYTETIILLDQVDAFLLWCKRAIVNMTLGSGTGKLVCNPIEQAKVMVRLMILPPLESLEMNVFTFASALIWVTITRSKRTVEIAAQLWRRCNGEQD